MMSPCTRIPERSAQAGATVVEMAVVLGVFMMIVFGIIEFGRALWSYNTLGYAVREGSRYAVVHGSGSGTPVVTEAAIKQQVIHAATGLNLLPSGVTVSYSPSGNNEPGSAVTVAATYQFVPATSYVPAIAISSNSTQIILR